MNIEYPGAVIRPLQNKSTTLLTPKFINVHTIVGYMDSTYHYFNQSGRPYSHFGTNHAGRVEQWQDLLYKAASDLDGNPWSISVENEDHGLAYGDWDGSDVPRFTPPQAEAIAQLIAWLCVRFAIPAVLLADSLPIPHGVSFHRLGIDPWRLPGGILYSSADGKVCPGNRRIAQLRDEIMPRVKAILGGATVVTEAQMKELKEHINYQMRYLALFLAKGPNSVYNPGLTEYAWVDDPDVWTIKELKEHLDKVDKHGGPLEDPNGDGQLTWTYVRQIQESLDRLRELNPGA